MYSNFDWHNRYYYCNSTRSKETCRLTKPTIQSSVLVPYKASSSKHLRHFIVCLFFVVVFQDMKSNFCWLKVKHSQKWLTRASIQAHHPSGLCLSICVFVCVFVWLFVCFFLFFFASLFVCFFVRSCVCYLLCLFVCLFVWLVYWSVSLLVAWLVNCLCVYLFVCLFV